jgi:2-polyprenyl-6-hydroxyphenyl methylase/3-demethylubiquinone-9 3-methyltransferase
MNPRAFGFGRNWRHFVRSYLTPERVALATRSVRDFLGVQDLRGKTFVDVGAGSGIDSLAALELGATAILSVDYDPDCIACCETLRAEAGNPAPWRVVQGSAIDDAFMASLGTFDVVYCWGVLHHTGAMWRGIENTLRLVKPGGVCFLAIYNKADGLAIYPDGRVGPSSFWWWEKRFYSKLPWVLQNAIDYVVMGGLVLGYLVSFRNPVRVIGEHRYYFNKGMSWRINVKDWLGGYPYEVATVAEIFRFAHERGFTLENLTCNNGLLNNEYLLRRTV